MALIRRFIYYSVLLMIVVVVDSNMAASIADHNSVYETPRINNGDQLIQSIVNDCFDGDAMYCLKGKVLTYLDSMLNLREEQGRSFESNHIDKIIYNRVSKLLQTNEFQVKLPETIFQNAIVSYRSDRGFDIDLPEDNSEQGRGYLLKKKLLFPILLLLKLKMKLLMPIIVALVGLKAMKALILSKLAITLVLGFVIYNLVKSKGMAMPMAMQPMMPSATGESPMTAYGPPSSAPSTSSYDPSNWEPSSGGPYARIWEPSSGSSSSSSGHNLAYSSYYPSRSASSSLSSSINDSSNGSSSSPSSSSSSSHSSYSS